MEFERKLVQWRNEGLIDQSTIERILSFEKGQPSKRKIPLLLLIGLIFFALAVFSFIAANWQAIPDLLKVAVFVLLMWLFYIAAFYSEKKNFSKPIIFRMLGLAMFGATILVTAQTFHFNISNSVLPWAIFIVALAHYFQWRHIAYSITAFIFGVSLLFSFLPNTGWFEWSLFAVIVLGWFYFSRDGAPKVFSWMLLFFSGLLMWDLVTYNSPFWPIWTLFALVLLLFLLPTTKQKLLMPLYLMFGSIMLIVYLALRGETEMSFVDLNWTESIALAVAGVIVLFFTYTKFKDISWISILGAMGLLLFDSTAIALAAIAEISALAYLMIAQRQNKSLAAGFIYFILVQFVIYVIYAWERLDMSLFFLIGALLLFALSGAAWWLNRKREGATS